MTTKNIHLHWQLESLLDIEIPARAKFTRVLFLEISRLLNHLLAVTTQCFRYRALNPLFMGFEERGKINGILCPTCFWARLTC